MSMRNHLRGRRPGGMSDSSASSAAKIVVLGLALAFLLTAATLVYIKGQNAVIRTDSTTLCPIDRPPSEVTVLLLDMSDEFSEPQRLKIKNELDRLKSKIARFGLIEAYVVDRLDQRVTKPLVHLCNPGTGDDLNRLYQNPDMARRKWEGFVHQLDEKVELLMASPESPTSAIFEAVQATALRTFNRPENEAIGKHLVIVSDLLQNVPGKLSQYEHTPSFREFQSTEYFSQVRADLKDVAVTLLYLVRPRAPQKWPDHYQFWNEYFVAQGARVELVEPVYGAP